MDTASWDSLGERDAWLARWREAQDEHGGHWDGLLDLAGDWEPITVALVMGEKPGEACWANVWDGNHRLGAAAMLDLVPGPLVLGVPQGLRWEEVPTVWQQLPALQQHFQRPTARPRLR